MKRRKFFGWMGKGTLLSFMAAPLIAAAKTDSLPDRGTHLLKDQEVIQAARL